nr:MaoC family dehydratase N-terminal domain-containing protein [Brevibacillus fulvus]
MQIEPSVIGTASDPKLFEIEKGAIRAFANAIGDDNPLYTDEDFAKRQGFASLVAPPTFPTTFRLHNPRLQIKAARILHGEQEYRYMRPIVAGDVLQCVSQVVDVYERTGKLGAMTFLVTEIQGHDLAGNLVFTGRSTIIL